MLCNMVVSDGDNDVKGSKHLILARDTMLEVRNALCHVLPGSETLLNRTLAL